MQLIRLLFQGTKKKLCDSILISLNERTFKNIVHRIITFICAFKKLTLTEIFYLKQKSNGT